MFDLLENSPDAVNIYEKWIEKIPHERVDVSIKSYKGVNLDDPDQRDRLLFPLFRFNMNVIDFWLSNVVYPHELKIFEKKLMCTAWDLCSDQLKHRVTGFSGTNDTQNTLPITIAQSDLPELNNTNEEMRQTLLDRRNRVYKNKNNITGKNILQELVRLEIPVLLDSGALMLELNNKEVAIEWLKLAPNCSAAVYFDENDTLQTIDHNGIVTEFDYSVYRDDLSNCVVYLDDVHTRGTDLKFPPDSMACVTLSGKEILYIFRTSIDSIGSIQIIRKKMPSDKLYSHHQRFTPFQVTLLETNWCNRACVCVNCEQPNRFYSGRQMKQTFDCESYHDNVMLRANTLCSSLKITAVSLKHQTCHIGRRAH